MRDTRWVDAMVGLLRYYLLHGTSAERYFRWFDSGDLEDVDQLARIVEVARRTPWLSHWLPTHEPEVVAAYVRERGRRAIPENLVIRVSSDVIGHPFKYDERAARVSVTAGRIKEEDAAGWRRRVPRLLASFPTSTTHVGEGSPPVPVSERRGDSVECRSYARDHVCGTCRACWSPDVRNVSYPLTGGDAAINRVRRSPALRVIS